MKCFLGRKTENKWRKKVEVVDIPKKSCIFVGKRTVKYNIMNNSPIISQTKLNVLQERVCSPINYLCNKIDSATPLWDGPIKMCQQIEDDQFAVDTVVMEAKKHNGAFNGVNTPRFYHAILCRVYIILYYLHPDDQLYQEIVFPRLKKNMGVYNDVHLNSINEQIDKILAQEKLLKKVQAEKKKDVKPVFAYVRHNGNEQDHLYIEYSEELLFRGMKGIIKGLSDRYGTHQDEANVWFNAKKIVHTLRDVKRPELLIDRAATALVAGQMYNEYKGSQIILICAYAMIRSSKDNTHFASFIQKMESLADEDTDLVVIKMSIHAIKNWISDNLPFDEYDYIGEHTSSSENYTSADIERIRNQIVEHEKVEREKLLKRVEELESNEKTLKQQVSSLEKELEAEKAKKESDSTEEELKTENEVLKKQIEQLEQKIAENSGDGKWIDWLDEAVFHSSIKPWEVFDTFHGISTPNLTDNARCYVLFRVLDKIHWLKKNVHQKDIIKWAYAHSGISWKDSEKLRFSDLPDGILKKDISQWRSASQRKGDYYASFSEALLTEFIYRETKGIQDKRKYIKNNCTPINFIPK